jgi:CheY-like chemotaxis protein
MKVLIVDDHEGFRASARRMLEADGFEVVAEASSGGEALQAVETWSPELVLLDVHLPDMQGFEVAERLRMNGSAPAVVLTSSHDASDFGPLIEGSGFIPKSELTGEALRRILDEQP